MTRCDIDSEQALSFFPQLYGSLHYWKMDGKNILDTTKLVKEMV